MLRNLVLFGCCAFLLRADTRLGPPFTLNQPLTVDEVIASSASLSGQKVQVKGKVTEVCQMAGCWMQLAGTGTNALRIKVKDGDLVFPQGSAGKTAIAEGVLEKLELSREQAVARAKHEAEERGVKFNPASVRSGVTIFQVRGTSAQILD